MDPIGKIFFSRVSRSVPFFKKKDPRRGAGVLKNRCDFVFGENFGASSDIILRFIAVWLIRHSTGRGAEEYA